MHIYKSPGTRLLQRSEMRSPLLFARRSQRPCRKNAHEERQHVSQSSLLEHVFRKRTHIPPLTSSTGSRPPGQTYVRLIGKVADSAGHNNNIHEGDESGAFGPTEILIAVADHAWQERKKVGGLEPEFSSKTLIESEG